MNSKYNIKIRPMNLGELEIYNEYLSFARATIFSHFSHIKHEIRDLISIGYIGLGLAVISRDDFPDVDFKLYATRVICSEVQKYLIKANKYQPLLKILRLRSNDETFKKALISEIYATLPPHKQNLAKMLMEGESFSEIGRRVGRKHTTIRNMFLRIGRNLNRAKTNCNISLIVN